MAAGLCLTRAITVRGERTPWFVLGAGLLAWAGGEVYYSVFYADLAEPPLPGVSDGLWLTFYPACYIAIVLLVRERVRQFRTSLWLDGLVGALAASAIAAALVFGAIVGQGREDAVVAVDLSYALGDLLLLGFVVGVFGLTGWRPGRALLLVGAGLMTSAVVDGFFLYESALGLSVDSTLMATLWPASALLLGFAAWQRPTVAEPVRFEGSRVLLMPAVVRGGRTGAAGVALGRRPAERARAGARDRHARRRDPAHVDHVPREHPPARLQPPRRAHRLAHRARQPPRADGGPRGRGRRRDRARGPAAWCCSTWTASSSTTTASATRWATRCWRASASGSAMPSRTTAHTGSAATSSACSPAAARRRSSRSPRKRARRSPSAAPASRSAAPRARR